MLYTTQLSSGYLINNDDEYARSSLSPTFRGKVEQLHILCCLKGFL